MDRIQMDNVVELDTARQVVNTIENVMRTMPQVDLRVEHHFSLGVYARTLYIPKGVTLTGHVHKYENLNILIQGELSVLVGKEVQLIKAPFTVVSPPGTKRIATAIEDSIWMTIHGTHETDLNLIKQEFIAESEEEYLEFVKDNQLKLDLKA